ncbi:MAG TPA: hypothetical protein VJ851_16205 [Jatrophihabitans sp.]|nr:hypothetical protein [Jatrophihabitans sp.]
MPEPLVCEDSDLDRLMRTVHSQAGARILYQDTVRRGGVLGFFAREVHRVAYQVPAAPDSQPAIPNLEPAEPSSQAAAADADEPVLTPELAELLARSAPDSFEAALQSFDAATDRLESAVEPDSTAPDSTAPDFAELLRRLTDAEDNIEPAPADLVLAAAEDFEPVATSQPRHLIDPPRRTASSPRRSSTPIAAVTSIGRPEARHRLELLLQLRQVGVPVSVNPSSETHNLYQALEDILQDLPAAVEPPRQAGAVLAIVGEATPALQVARTVAAMLRIAEDTIGVAGLPPAVITGLGLCQLSGVREAQRLRQQLRLADTPSIVVIATDGAVNDPDDPWAGQLLTALAPTATWVAIDARWKTEDSRAYLDRIPTVDALAVYAAELSGSPASVWDLDLPLAMLDGRPPTTFAWTGLLFRLLGCGARHRASA